MENKRVIMLKNLFSGGFIIFGVLGLVVSLLGEVTSLGNYASLPPQSWEKFDSQLVSETPDLILLTDKLSALLQSSQNTSSQEKMLTAYHLVINRFTHSDQAKYNIFSNWLLWLMGEIYSPFSYILNPHVLVEKGHSALCSEQAYLLQTLAESANIPTRAVYLNGHVVMEAWYANDWHLFDPDLEVVPVLENGRILSLDELAQSPELIQKYYMHRGTAEYVQHIVKIISSRQDNAFVLYWMMEKHLNYRLQKIAYYLKWIFPLFLLLMGIGLYVKKSKKN